MDVMALLLSPYPPRSLIHNPVVVISDVLEVHQKQPAATCTHPPFSGPEGDTQTHSNSSFSRSRLAYTRTQTKSSHNRTHLRPLGAVPQTYLNSRFRRFLRSRFLIMRFLWRRRSPTRCQVPPTTSDCEYKLGREADMHVHECHACRGFGTYSGPVGCAMLSVYCLLTACAGARMPTTAELRYSKEQIKIMHPADSFKRV
jgi:hypothetical protein